MRKSLLVKLFICFAAFSFYLYSVLQSQNTLNYLSYKLPKIEKELRAIEEDNVKLSFQLQVFHDPRHLLDLLKEEMYSHLKYPFLEDVLNLDQGIALKLKAPSQFKKPHLDPHEDIAIAHR